MRRAQRWMLSGMALGLGAFILIALDDLAQGPLYQTDTLVYDAVTSWEEETGVADPLGDVLTWIGDWRTQVVAVGAAASWMLWRGQRALALWCAGIAACTGILVNVLKVAFARDRPPLGILHSYSFPSGHTFGAAASLGVAIILATETYVRMRHTGRKGTLHIWALALSVWALLSVLTAAGRVLAREHWMTDTLASLALGLALVSGLLLALSRSQHTGDPGPTVPEKRGEEAGKKSERPAAP